MFKFFHPLIYLNLIGASWRLRHWSVTSHRYEKNCWHFGYFQTHRKQPVLRIWLD